VPRAFTGAPRNEVIGGWFGGKPTERGSREMSASLSGVADGSPDVFVDADRDELLDATVGIEHAERAVASAGDLPCQLDDAPEHGGEREVGGEREARLEQDVLARFAGDHLCIGAYTDGVRGHRLRSRRCCRDAGRP
jgi:hypothetical protein